MHRALVAVTLAVGGIAAEAAAQGARIQNAKLQQVAATSPLTTQFRALVDRQVEPAWIAYVQPIVDGTLTSCCWGWNSGDGRSTCCAACPLEGQSNPTTVTDQSKDASLAAAAPIKLEGATDFVLLFRVDGRRIDRVRVYSADCVLDAGGLTVHVLDGVKAPDSIALLESVVTTWPTMSTKTVPDAVVMGIALHKDPAADAALGRLLASTNPDELRRKALFWSARARGRPGFEAVRRVLRDEPNLRVRKQAVFALTQSREPEVIPLLIDAARNNQDADVRKEALFWLAQKAGKQAEQTITNAIDNDPDTEVKKKAVFALTRLPKDESIPALINVARTNRNAAVRKQAMFWLGQSRDPRAVDFFESILK
jgi:HEAT repeats